MDAHETDRLLEAYRRTGDRTIRNKVVEAHLEISRFAIRRLARGDAVLVEDLRQVALLAVVNATERYRSGRGASFKTFAQRTIDGELKRHLRDRTWVVRPPRGRQEQFLHVCREREDLTHSLGRAPMTDEIAERTGLSVDEVLQAIEAGGARSAQPLEPSRRTDDVVTDRPETTSVEAGFAVFERHVDLRSAIRSLDERECRVLHLRFVDECSQPEIGDRLGLSQSYVSRIIRRALEKLRDEMDADGPRPEMDREYAARVA